MVQQLGRCPSWGESRHVCVRPAEPLHWSETITALLVGYTPEQNKQFRKGKTALPGQGVKARSLIG